MHNVKWSSYASPTNFPMWLSTLRSSILNFQDPRFMNARMPVQSYVWDTMNPNTPDVALTPPSPLCCLRFNPKVGLSNKGHIVSSVLQVLCMVPVHQDRMHATQIGSVREGEASPNNQNSVFFLPTQEGIYLHRGLRHALGCEVPTLLVYPHIFFLHNPGKLLHSELLLPINPCAVAHQSTDNLVGGSYNGLINFFDLRKPGATIGHAVPLETSVIEKSHHDPVYDVFWISSKTGDTCRRKRRSRGGILTFRSTVAQAVNLNILVHFKPWKYEGVQLFVLHIGKQQAHDVANRSAPRPISSGGGTYMFLICSSVRFTCFLKHAALSCGRNIS